MPENDYNQLKIDHEVLKTDINAQLREINSKLDVILSGKGGNCIEHRARVEQIEQQVANMQSNISWLWKSILGAILSGIGLMIFKNLANR